VTSIGENAFEGCDSLQYASIPAALNYTRSHEIYNKKKIPLTETKICFPEHTKIERR
jgi:hypothetical protein